MRMKHFIKNCLKEALNAFQITKITILFIVGTLLVENLVLFHVKYVHTGSPREHICYS